MSEDVFEPAKNKKATSKTKAKEKKEEQKRKIHTTFKQVGGFLLEEVYRHGGLQFCVYDLDSHNYEFQDVFELVGYDIEYWPYACETLIEKAFMFLPTEPEEYGSVGDLVQLIQDRLHKWCDYELKYEKLDPYYVLLTWLSDLMPVTPYRRALGEWGEGKTRWLETMVSMCRLGYKLGASATSATIYRLSNLMRGTMAIDENLFDRKSEQGQAILNILNSGYSKATGVVYRCEGEKNIPQPFVSYCPKLIASRKKFPDQATESRTITHNSYKAERLDIPTLISTEFYREAIPIRNQLLKWRFDNYTENFQFDQDFDALKLEPRLKEIMLPLVSIMETQEMKKIIKDTAKEINLEIVGGRAMRLERSIVIAIVRLWRNNVVMSCKAVANVTREIEQMEESEFSPRKCGWYLRNTLRLKVDRLRVGNNPFGVLRNEDNKTRLKRLLKAYDIRKEDI